MALTDIFSAIQFWNSSTNPWVQSTAPEALVGDFTAGAGSEQSQIHSYISLLYTSPTAAATMEQVRTNHPTIRIGKALDLLSPAFVALGATGQYYLGFNNTEVAKIWYINTQGTLVAENPGLTLIHEFSHMIGRTDPTGAGPGGVPTEAEQNVGNWDFEGSALRLQNQVATELSLFSNFQASYDATLGGQDTRRGSFTLSTNYTENEAIKIVRIGTDGVNDLDMSNRTHDSRDLLFGLGGNDVLKGGGGRDFLRRCRRGPDMGRRRQ
ncbi:MAG TPA: hypothetical protein VMS43_06145 [Allosphingosinicella sp.]|nr:hypothetical protein [Allosphingosinicella sp.]